MRGSEFDRVVRGAAIAVATLALARGATPLIRALPTESVDSLFLAALIVVSYGIYIAITAFGWWLMGLKEAYDEGGESS